MDPRGKAFAISCHFSLKGSREAGTIAMLSSLAFNKTTGGL